MSSRKIAFDYEPDSWVIAKIKDDVIKVVAGWSGGYLYGDSWRVNSGIKKWEEHGDYYLAYGYSSSIYKLNKNSENIRMSMAYPLQKIKEIGGVVIDAKKIRIQNGKTTI